MVSVHAIKLDIIFLMAGYAYADEVVKIDARYRNGGKYFCRGSALVYLEPYICSLCRMVPMYIYPDPSADRNHMCIIRIPHPFLCRTIVGTEVTIGIYCKIDSSDIHSLVHHRRHLCPRYLV